MERTSISIDDFGGDIVDGGMDALLAPVTSEERMQDAIDLADIEQAERKAAAERPHFI